MPTKFKIKATKDYATEANADSAVEKAGFGHLRYFIHTQTNTAGIVRYFPVFVGEQAAIEGVHFHFNILA